MSIGPPIPEIQHFQNLTLKIQGQGHSSGSQIRYKILSTHVPFVPFRSALPFLGYSYFKIWHWKFIVYVMGEVTTWVQHSVDSYPFRSMSIGHPITELFDLENQGSRSWWGHTHTVQSHNVGLTSYRFTPLSFHVKRASHSWVTTLSKFDLENQGQMTVMLHKYRCIQFHRTLNGINPSSGFWDMGSAKSGPSAAWLDTFLAHGQAHMEMGKLS